MNWLLHLAAAFLGSLGFAVLFQIRGKKLFYAALGGLITWGVYLLPFSLGVNQALSYFIASITATLYAELFARLLKAPATTFLSPAIITLVPGGWLYYTMSAMVESDWAKAAECANRTLVLALTIVGGIMLVTSLQKILYSRVRKGELHGKTTV